ncbi:hypothetical protein [Hymenobacter perfusus]|uniref:Uncharacterized protein n=1 Tax=Hymenobacter perfusus TaxID=1236770 RepID=A0A3R9NAK9_9BACT|nr:hypothetical protein [Hymenobacter perfusus]RSK42783.1 hypothetical protein EI293_13370 [Hymenobacter perfusus]
MLTFVLGSAFVIVFLTVWVMLPYWIYQQIIKLADLPLGPLRTGLNWWLAGTYYLMPMVTGLLVLLKGFTYFLDPTSLFPYFVVWVVAMLVALVPGYIGFRRWYKQQVPE